MGEPITHSTQYGDYNGTLSIDKADGRELLQLLGKKVGLSRGYYPVGFSVSALGGGLQAGHRWSLIVYAVDSQIATDENELREYARKKVGSVPVFEFSVQLEPSDLADLLIQGIKRFSMLATTRSLEGMTLERLENN